LDILEQLSKSPACFHYLKWCVEFGYGNTKRRVSRDYPTGESIIDIGCGTGEFSHLFPQDCYLGVDIYHAYIEFARKRNPGYQFQVGDATALTSDDSYFNIALIHGLIHHLKDRDARLVIEQAHRVLKPQGVLILIEDIPARGLNILGHVMHSIDRGGWIRTPDEYIDLCGGLFSLIVQEIYRSGICDYHYCLMRREEA